MSKQTHFGSGGVGGFALMLYLVIAPSSCGGEGDDAGLGGAGSGAAPSNAAGANTGAGAGNSTGGSGGTNGNPSGGASGEPGSGGSQPGVGGGGPVQLVDENGMCGTGPDGRPPNGAACETGFCNLPPAGTYVGTCNCEDAGKWGCRYWEPLPNNGGSPNCPDGAGNGKACSDAGVGCLLSGRNGVGEVITCRCSEDTTWHCPG